MSPDSAETILSWMRANPRADCYPLAELIVAFPIGPERLRDRLQRLVNQGTVRQLPTVSGMVDDNPCFTLVE